MGAGRIPVEAIPGRDAAKAEGVGLSCSLWVWVD